MMANEIAQLISTVGFPIACCCVLFYQNGKMQETLHGVNVTMQSLVDKLEAMENRNQKGE